MLLLAVLLLMIVPMFACAVGTRRGRTQASSGRPSRPRRVPAIPREAQRRRARQRSRLSQAELYDVALGRRRPGAAS